MRRGALLGFGALVALLLLVTAAVLRLGSRTAGRPPADRDAVAVSIHRSWPAARLESLRLVNARYAQAVVVIAGRRLLLHYEKTRGRWLFETYNCLACAGRPLELGPAV
jgi:hypothetical protein